MRAAHICIQCGRYSRAEGDLLCAVCRKEQDDQREVSMIRLRRQIDQFDAVLAKLFKREPGDEDEAERDTDTA
jgi:hypothetical protein